MNILITGIHGFVGSNLVQALSKSHKLFGLDIVHPIKAGVEKTFIWKDLEEGKIPKMDVILHLAGKAHDTKNKADADSYFNVNTLLTYKIFDFFLASGARKFIFFSTVKAVADQVNNVLKEDIVPAPIGPYGESKLKAEEYIQTHLPINQTVFIIRPCMIHGPGNKGNLNLLYNVVKKGIPWPLGAFENRRSFTSIQNLIFVINELIEREIKSGVYNMADDESLSTNELIEIICSATNKTPRIVRFSPRLIFNLAKIGDILHLPLNVLRLQKLTENYVVSNEKIKNALNIDRMPVSSKEGLLQTIRSFQP